MAEEKPGWALMSVVLTADAVTLADAARSLDVPEQALDEAFGLVTVDRQNHIYAVQVRTDALTGREDGDPGYQGPYSNPEIAPFSLDEE